MMHYPNAVSFLNHFHQDWEDFHEDYPDLIESYVDSQYVNIDYVALPQELVALATAYENADSDDWLYEKYGVYFIPSADGFTASTLLLEFARLVRECLTKRNQQSQT
jgi:hypothetical protein